MGRITKKQQGRNDIQRAGLELRLRNLDSDIFYEVYSRSQFIGNLPVMKLLLDIAEGVEREHGKADDREEDARADGYEEGKVDGKKEAAEIISGLIEETEGLIACLNSDDQKTREEIPDAIKCVEREIGRVAKELNP